MRVVIYGNKNLIAITLGGKSIRTVGGESTYCLLSPTHRYIRMTCMYTFNYLLLSGLARTGSLPRLHPPKDLRLLGKRDTQVPPDGQV